MHRRLLSLAVAVAAVLVPVSPAQADGEPTLTCFPLAPAEIRYDNTWGAARSGGRGHQGTDVMAPKGTVVMAVADGVVETLDMASGAGFYVRLIHDGGWETWYMHLDNDSPGTDDGHGGETTAYAPGLAVGDEVVAGQIIGYVGDSGNAEWTGPHLHFEFHIGGGPTNPYPALVEADERISLLRHVIEPIVLTGTSNEIVPNPIDISRRPDSGCLTPSLQGPAPAPAPVSLPADPPTIAPPIR